MPDWIDGIKAERDRSIKRALGQDAHAAVNARYPGITREHCCECGAETGRAGRGEDSLYASDDTGPYCEDCFPERED